MRTIFKAFAALAKGEPLKPFEFDAGPLQSEQVEIAVTNAGTKDPSFFGNEARVIAPRFRQSGTLPHIACRTRILPPRNPNNIPPEVAELSRMGGSAWSIGASAAARMMAKAPRARCIRCNDE